MPTISRFASFLAPLVLLAAGAFAGDGTDPDAVAKIKNRAKEIAAKMETLRALPFKEEVEVGVKTEEELLGFLKTSMDEEMPDAMIRKVHRAYAKMGLLPDDMDLKKVFLDMMTSQIGGFYDPKKKQLFLIDRKGKPGAAAGQAAVMEGALRMLGFTMDDLVSAHELTHALQDQHFGLDKVEERARNNDDRIMAYKCVFEGDASIAMWEPLIEKMPMLRGMMKQMEGMDAGAALGSELKDVPAILKVPLAYPYIGGAALANRAREKGGWEAVNALFEDPPLSSEQVLHLDKFFGERDDPVFVHFDTVEALAPKGWELLETNSLGELGTRILLDEFLSKKKAERGAAGWDGDRFAAFGSGDDAFFFWYTTWDSGDEAREFAELYLELLAKKFALPEGGRPRFEGAASQVSIGKGKDYVVVSLKGSDVVVVEGLLAEEAQDLNDRLFRDVRKFAPGEEPAAPLAPVLPAHPAATVRGDGFSFAPPAGWETTRSERFGRVTCTEPGEGPGRTRLEIGALPLAEAMEPAEVGRAVEAALPGRLEDYSADESGPRELFGNRAFVIRYRGRDPESGRPFLYLTMVFTRGAKAVILTVAAPGGATGQAMESVQEALRRSFRLE